MCIFILLITEADSIFLQLFGQILFSYYNVWTVSLFEGKREEEEKEQLKAKGYRKKKRRKMVHWNERKSEQFLKYINKLLSISKK